MRNISEEIFSSTCRNEPSYMITYFDKILNSSYIHGMWPLKQHIYTTYIHYKS